MEKKCFAKINLSLDSLYKRSDGYHELDMLMARVSLFDRIRIKKNGTGSFNYSSNLDFGSLDDNLVYKARDLLREGRKDFGVDCYLEKNIPLGGGLGGGSSDGAETMKILNEIFDLGLRKTDLQKKSLKLGADFPFFFEKSPCRCQGIGEILSPFEINLRPRILLINDGTGVSSSFVYKKLGDYGVVDNEKIIEGFKLKNPAVLKSLRNVMEDVVFEYFPNLLAIRNKLSDLGADASLMSGSGGSMFGLFLDSNKFETAFSTLKNSYPLVREVYFIDD